MGDMAAAHRVAGGGGSKRKDVFPVAVPCKVQQHKVHVHWVGLDSIL